ncbi:hypothetical protein [Cryobacterium soli]|uniref:hypothetical protein n=1 Tax=Cryobacterium soli TaxID=2220095 RepID=UPI0013C4E1B4|nr:hypothetical protein [Cryobacterium soli]
MHTQLAPRPGRHDHPPQPVPHPEPRPVRRVGPLDRAAMHLGMALIAWGRRPVRTPRRERPVFSPESVQARRDLENARDQYLVLKLTQFR